MAYDSHVCGLPLTPITVSGRYTIPVRMPDSLVSTLTGRVRAAVAGRGARR